MVRRFHALAREAAGAPYRCWWYRCRCGCRLRPLLPLLCTAGDRLASTRRTPRHYSPRKAAQHARTGGSGRCRMASQPRHCCCCCCYYSHRLHDHGLRRAPRCSKQANCWRYLVHHRSTRRPPLLRAEAADAGDEDGSGHRCCCYYCWQSGFALIGLDSPAAVGAAAEDAADAMVDGGDVTTGDGCDYCCCGCCLTKYEDETVVDVAILVLGC